MKKLLQTSSKAFAISLAGLFLALFISDGLEGHVGPNLAFPLRLLPLIMLGIFGVATVSQLSISYIALIWRKAQFRNFDIWMFVFAHVFGFFIFIATMLVRPFSGVLG